MVENCVKWILSAVVLGLAYWNVQLLVRGIIWAVILSLALGGIGQLAEFAKGRKDK